MTTQARKAIHFDVSKSHGWKDAFVVGFLAIVLGAFIAQISSAPGSASRHASVAAAPGAFVVRA